MSLPKLEYKTFLCKSCKQYQLLPGYEREGVQICGSCYGIPKVKTPNPLQRAKIKAFQAEYYLKRKTDPALWEQKQARDYELAVAKFETQKDLYCRYCHTHRPKSMFASAQQEYGLRSRMCVHCDLKTDHGSKQRQNRLRVKKSTVPLAYGGGKEVDLQQYIHKHVGGEREIQTEAGAIDLLTPTRLIEVKEYKGWKGALGQLLSYDYALNQNPNEIWLPKLTAVLYWLKIPPRAELNTMFSTFKHFDIEVFTTWSKDEHSLQNLLNECPKHPKHPPPI